MNFISSIFKQPSSSTSTDDQSPDSDNGEAVKVTIKTDKVFKDDSSLDKSSVNANTTKGKVDNIFHHRKRFLSDDMSPKQILESNQNDIVITITSLKDDHLQTKKTDTKVNKKSFRYYLKMLVLFITILGILAFLFNLKRLVISQ